MKRVLKAMGYLAILVLFVAIFIGVGIGVEKYQMRKDIEAKLVDEQDASILPKKRIITDEMIEAKLINIKEVSTSSCEYTVARAFEYPRYIFGDIPIPFTTNKIAIECKGIVKVGYDVTQIKKRVDHISKIIYVSLPEPSVHSNDIDMENIRVAEKNNILNPIDFSQYQTVIAEIEEIGLEQAIEKGIYKTADKNVRKVIEDVLSGFGYQIIFL